MPAIVIKSDSKSIVFDVNFSIKNMIKYRKEFHSDFIKDIEDINKKKNERVLKSVSCLNKKQIETLRSGDVPDELLHNLDLSDMQSSNLDTDDYVKILHMFYALDDEMIDFDKWESSITVFPFESAFDALYKLFKQSTQTTVSIKN